MISAREILAGLTAVLGTARGVEGWARLFDDTPDGIRRSAFTLGLAAPFILLTNEGVRRAAIAAAVPDPLLAVDPLTYGVVQLLMTYAGWLIALFVMLTLGRARGAAGPGPIILAQNYSVLLVYVVMTLLVGLPSAFGLGIALPVFSLPVLLFSLWIDWGILRRPVNLSPLEAGLMLVASLLLSIALGSLGDMLLSLFLPVT